MRGFGILRPGENGCSKAAPPHDLIRRLFDKKSEALDSAQLALPFAPEAAGQGEAAATAGQEPAAGAPARKRSPNKPRDLSHLEVRETVIVHNEVRANPDAYREIERIVTDRFDYQPPAVFIERTVRVVHVAIGQPDAVPLKPPAPRSLELSATARMVAYCTASKYCHHRPHFRIDGILRDRHGVEIPRHSLSHWDKVVADTLEPLYKLIHRSIDESQNFFKTRLANNIVCRAIHLVQGGPLQQVEPRQLEIVPGEGEKFQMRGVPIMASSKPSDRHRSTPPCVSGQMMSE